MIANIVGSRTLKTQWNETAKYYSKNTFLEYVSNENKIIKFTYEEFDQKIKQAANAFYDFGIRQYDIVGLHMHNSPEYLYSWLALAQIGAVSVPMNEYYRARECLYIIKKCNMKYLVTEQQKINLYIENTNKFNLKKVIISGDTNNNRLCSLSFLMTKQPSELKYSPKVLSSDTAVLLFTSGTTKDPKGAVYTHACVIYGGILHAAQIGMNEGDRFLTSMPCYHMDFQEMAVAPVLCSGSTLIMIEHYSAGRFWKQICDMKANFTDTMSIMNRTMLLQPKRKWEKNHKLKQIYFSMGLSNKEKEEFENRFHVRLLNSYGMTETVSAVTCVPLYGDQHWPSVGRPALSYEIKIIDENGNTLPPNFNGEICIHGIPGVSLIKGYYNDEEATKQLIDKDGWIHSGDCGYLDENGWLFFTGRCGDMIKRKGENISCAEVEFVLTSHEEIVDAAVIGIPDPICDQSIKAYIQIKQHSNIQKSDIIEHCQKNLAKFKIPTDIEFVKNFPRTATGKIKKHLL